MSSRAKHAQRSHKTCSNNYSTFSKFEVKASKIKDVRKLTAVEKTTLLERIKKLFKHQDR